MCHRPCNLFSVKLILPSGYYCIPELVTAGDAGSTYTPCPRGFYCPNGTGHDWQPCPAGSYGPVEGLTDSQDCTPCDAGMYCQGVNLTEPTDVCDPGYYCISGVDKPDPVMIDENQCPTNSVHPIIGHICPEGHFCEAGTVYPEGMLCFY